MLYTPKTKLCITGTSRLELRVSHSSVHHDICKYVSKNH